MFARSTLLAVCLIASPAIAEPCAPPPAPVRDLDIPRFYADQAGSRIDPALQAAHDAAVAPLNRFLRQVTGDADKALRRASMPARRAMAGCALDALATWASDRALLGNMTQAQAEYQRKWDFTGLALAYVKLQPFADARQRGLIEPWLIDLADAARRFFDDPARSRNNHWYWLGPGLAAVALTTGSERHWTMARGIMKDAAADISPKGLLAKELERQSRALFYHVFSVVPLVVMAEMAASRGEDWYALGDGALHRLVGAVHDGLGQPRTFQALTGMAQEGADNTRAGWLQLYLARFPERLKPPHPVVALANRWIGGDAALLKSALQSIPRR